MGEGPARDGLGGRESSGEWSGLEDGPNKFFNPPPRRLLNLRFGTKTSSPSDCMFSADVDCDSGDGVVLRGTCMLIRDRGGFNCRSCKSEREDGGVQYHLRL
jgi:hypothetical protein